MRKEAAIAVIVLYSGIVGGSGVAATEIPTGSRNERTEVFFEVRDDGPIPKGFAGLAIRADIKTHREGYYFMEAEDSRHGKEKYPFLVSIDGQAVRWEVDGFKDVTPRYDADGKTSRDPEAGEGMKYVLDREILLRAGPHRVFFSLPEDDYVTEAGIELSEGERSILEFRPVYRTKSSPVRVPSFVKGIKEYDIFLNGEPIPGN